MDKRKNNGGARKNAGRKSDERITEFNALFDAVVSPERMRKMIQRLAQQVEQEGDVRAFVALTNRRYGLPKQPIEMDAEICVYMNDRPPQKS